MPRKVESLLLAGLAAGVVASLLEAIPGGTGCLTCAAYIGSGMLAVWHYANTYSLTLRASTGAGMGVTAGLLSALVSGAINYVIAKLGGAADFQEQMQTGLRALEDSGMSPEQIDQLRAWMSSPGFLVTAVLFGMVLIGAMGALGGVIGAGAFRKGAGESGEAEN